MLRVSIHAGPKGTRSKNDADLLTWFEGSSSDNNGKELGAQRLGMELEARGVSDDFRISRCLGYVDLRGVPIPTRGGLKINGAAIGDAQRASLIDDFEAVSTAHRDSGYALG
jgi:hypothetical protein